MAPIMDLVPDTVPHPDAATELVADCSRCVGLCCVVLPFNRGASFAFDKAAGEACRHLGADHGCGIHARLRDQGMKGCTVYDCFGAGQYVVQVSGDHSAFGVVVRLHEMLTLLDQAAALVPNDSGPGRLRRQVLAAREDPHDAGVDGLTAQVGEELRRVSLVVRGPDAPTYAGGDLVGRDLRELDLTRADLRGALLIAADLRGVDLDRADLLGADLRDADLRDADVSRALFLTRPQLAAARID